MSIAILCCLAIAEGYLEQIIYRRGYRGSGTKLFNWLRMEYHVPLGLKWAGICLLAGELWFVGIFAVIQDWSWFRFHPHDELDPYDWISKPFGGFWIFNAWIPNAYLVGVGVSASLYYLL